MSRRQENILSHCYFLVEFRKTLSGQEARAGREAAKGIENWKFESGGRE